MVEEKGWTCFTLNKNSGIFYFKKFDYEVTPDLLKPNSTAEAIWIYNSKGHDTAFEKWKSVPGFDIPG